MKVTVIGAGYVGLVTGACLAEMGNHVVCVDVDEQKIRVLKDGGIPIHEPGLDEVVRRNVAGSRLEFNTDLGAAIGHLTILMIAVCPPPDEDGAACGLLWETCAPSAPRRAACSRDHVPA